jgi:hypothetical protein
VTFNKMRGVSKEALLTSVSSDFETCTSLTSSLSGTSQRATPLDRRIPVEWPGNYGLDYDPFDALTFEPYI